jgi:hypothetical protein
MRAKRKQQQSQWTKTRSHKFSANIQQAWKQTQQAKCAYKKAKHAYEKSPTLKSLMHIQTDIVGLEKKYEHIQAKVIENAAMMSINSDEMI